MKFIIKKIKKNFLNLKMLKMKMNLKILLKKKY